VPQYFKSVSVGPVLNQPYSSDFAWRTKNLLWDELNVLKRKLNVKIKNSINNTIDDYRFKSSMPFQKVRALISGRSRYLAWQRPPNQILTFID
jgi:hypothetical protein